MFGYPTNDDYYRDASPVHKLESVQVPMLCLNAADDVFSPSHGGLLHSQKVYRGLIAFGNTEYGIMVKFRICDVCCLSFILFTK